MLRAFGQSAHLAKRGAHLTNLPKVLHLANCAAQITNAVCAIVFQ